MLTVVLATSSIAHAVCDGGSKTVFSCVTKKGKQIEVCDKGKTLSYSFGKPGKKPEIVVSVPRGHASTTQWNGMGRYISYSVTIPNGDTEYSVFHGFDKIDDKIEAGVNVSIKGKHAATVYCSDKNLVHDLEGIDLKPTAE